MKFSGYTSFLARRGRVILVATALIMAASALGIARLSIRTEFSVFMPPDSVHLEAINRTAESFGDTAQLLLLAEIGPVGSPGSDRVGPGEASAADWTLAEPTLKLLPELATDLAGIEGVESVQAPIPHSVAELTGQEFTEALSQIQALTSSALNNHDGKGYATFRVLTSDGADLKWVIGEIESRFEDAGLPVTISGEAYLETEIFSYIIRILTTIPPIAVMLMLLVFRLRIGSFRATILSLVPAAVGSAVTLGIMGWILGSVSVVSVLVPTIVIVLGSADGLHVTSHVMDSLNSGDENGIAVTRTLGAVGVPIVMTTVTTMAGFLSLMVINSEAIRELGAAAAVGILVAGAATWLILPTILLHQKPLQGKVPRKRPADLIPRALAKLRGWPSVVIAVVLVVAFVPGALRLKSSLSMIDIYRPRTSVRQSIEKTTDILGGSIPIYVTFPAENQTDIEVAEAVLGLQDAVAEAGLAGQSLSAYSVVRSLWEYVSENEGYPENPVVARTMITRIRLTNRSLMDEFFSDDGLGRVVFFLRDLDDRTLEDFTGLTSQVAGSSGLDLRPVGSAFVMKEMNDQIIPQLLASLGLAAAMVFALTALTQRSIALGLASTAPILITLVALFGTMGYAGINLSVVTGIMSGLTIGVGIDYAIHYVSLLRQSRKRGDEAPSDVALNYVATPVLANALGLAIGFTAMLFSPLQIHVTLSILVWVTMIASAFLSLTFLPTITRGRRPNPGRAK